jgi:hypothetical protein
VNFKDIPSDWKRVTRIAIDIEKDLERKLRYFANRPRDCALLLLGKSIEHFHDRNCLGLRLRFVFR